MKEKHTNGFEILISKKISCLKVHKLRGVHAKACGI